MSGSRKSGKAARRRAHARRLDNRRDPSATLLSELREQEKARRREERRPRDKQLAERNLLALSSGSRVRGGEHA